jgi:hypothetical protein
MDRNANFWDADGAAGGNDIRAQIAAAAARLVADEGLDYGAAKQRGAREVLGNGPIPRNSLPRNEDVDRALLEHLELFDPQHAERLAKMRAVAIDWMSRLEGFVPLATGAVWKGIATEYAVIHLQLFYDNGKELQYFLLDARIEFESISVPHFKGGGEVEAYQFEWQDECIVLSVYDHDDIKGALKTTNAGTGASAASDSAGSMPTAARGNRAALIALSMSAATSAPSGRGAQR